MWITSDILQIGMDYSYLKDLLIGIGNGGVVKHLRGIYFNFNKYDHIYRTNFDAMILITFYF